MPAAKCNLSPVPDEKFNNCPYLDVDLDLDMDMDRLV